MLKKPFVACALYRWDHSTVDPCIDFVDALRVARTAPPGVYVVVRTSDGRVLAAVAPGGKKHPDPNALRAWVGRMAVIQAGVAA